MLTILSEKKRRQFYERHLGETRPVLFEHSKEEGLMSGFTDNYIRIEAPFEAARINTIAPATLQSINAEGLVTIGIRAPESVVGR